MEWNPVYGLKEFRPQLSLNSKPALNSLIFRKVDENGEVSRLNNILMCNVYLERILSRLLTIQDFFGYSRSPRSSDSGFRF